VVDRRTSKKRKLAAIWRHGSIGEGRDQPRCEAASMAGLSKRKAVTAAATASSSQRGRPPTAEVVEIKYVLLGAAGVGKTSIASRLVRDRFRANEAPTIGAAFSTKMLTVDAPRQNSTSKKRVTLSSNPTKPTLVKAVLWDTAGQEKYHSLTPMYYRNAMCAVICYDITSRKSFEAAKKWSDELQLLGPQHIVLCVVGNKCDASKEQRQVPTSEAEAWSKAIGAALWEVCSKSHSNAQLCGSFCCASGPVLVCTAKQKAVFTLCSTSQTNTPVLTWFRPQRRYPPRRDRTLGECSRTPRFGYSGTPWHWTLDRRGIMSGRPPRRQRSLGGRALGDSVF
jgi:small GTP-binding protein